MLICCFKLMFSNIIISIELVQGAAQCTKSMEINFGGNKIFIYEMFQIAGSDLHHLVSCFWFHRRLPLLWLIDLDLYVFVESTIFLKSHVFLEFLMNTLGTASFLNVSCFWFHTPSPLLWLTDLVLFVFVGPMFCS